MLLVIHNLPSNMNYADIKQLIQSKSGLSQVILDNLKSEGITKRVTVGLADPEDAAIFVRKMNGLYLEGFQLYVEDVRVEKASEQPYRSNDNYNYGDALYSPSDVNYDEEYTPTQRFPSAAPVYHEKTVPVVNPMPMTNYGIDFSNMLYPAAQQNAMPMAPNFSSYGAQASALAGIQSQWGGVQDHRQNDVGYRQDMNDGNSARDREDVYGERNREPQGRGIKRGLSPQGRRADGFNASNRRSGGYDERPNFDSRAHSKWDETPAMTQQQRRDSPPRQSRFDNDRYNDREDRNIRKKPRNDRSPWQEQPRWQDRPDRFGNNSNQNLQSSNTSNVVWELSPVSLEPNRNDFSDRQATRKSNMQEHWKEPRQPAKRSAASRWESEVAAKKFAPFKNPGNTKCYNLRQRASAPDRQHFSNSHRESAHDRQYFSNSHRESAHDRHNFSNSRQDRTPRFISKEPVLYGSSAKQNTKPDSEIEPVSLEKQTSKSNTWRGQATSFIAKSIMNQYVKFKDPPGFLAEIKRIVRARIDNILGDNIYKDQDQIVELFRSRHSFSHDFVIYREAKKALLEKAQTDAKEVTDIPPPSKQAPKPNANKSANQSASNTKPLKTNASAPKKPEPKTTPTAKPDLKNNLPKYPQGDKKILFNMKQLEKKELSGEVVYELPPAKQKIVDEHADTLCDLFMGECLNPSDKEEETVCEEINNNAADEFRKMIRLQLSKRVLNVTTGLVVQLYFMYKPPRNDMLQAFLMDYDVISLKKAVRSKPMFVAMCATFEGFDKLCALGSVEIDGVNLKIRPRLATGQKVKRDNKTRQRFVAKHAEYIDDSLLKMPCDSSAPNTVPKEEKDSDSTTDTKVTSFNEIKNVKVENSESNVVEVKNEDKHVINANTKSEDQETKHESEQDDDWNGAWSDHETANAGANDDNDDGDENPDEDGNNEEDDNGEYDNENTTAENNDFDNVDEEDLEDW